MGLSGLENALSGLKVAQKQLDVISNNISNAQVEGFTRKILPQSSVILLGQGAGVSADPAIRNVDLNLQADLFAQVSYKEFYTVQVDALNRIQQFHGGPDAGAAFSAKLAELRDAFTSLDSDPSNSVIQNQVLNAAQDMAEKLNDFGDLVQTIRSDAETSISLAVSRANALIENIADLNQQVKQNYSINQSTAALEDERDKSIDALSEILELSFFERGDGVLVVQTARGVQLADEQPVELFFESSGIGPDSFYPDEENETLNGIYVGGNPDDLPAAYDIAQDSLSGELGALLELRDELMPRFQAQIDELAAQLAYRFDAQGLRLFTDASGSVPDVTVDPDLTTDPYTPVEYVGFAQEIRVNSLIEDDPSLLQQGTLSDTDATIQLGSNEVISRILEFTFGEAFEEQAVTETFDPSVALQDSSALNIISVNEVEGTVDLSNFTSVQDIISAAGGLMTDGADSFSISFSDADITTGSVVVSIDLSSITPVAGLNAAEELEAAIEAQLSGNSTADILNISIDVSSNGALEIDTRGDFEFINSTAVADNISTSALSTYIGFQTGLNEATDPYFDIRVGNNDYTRISIDPNDTINDLIAKLDLDVDSTSSGITSTGVNDLQVEVDTTANTFITLSPGEDFGGSLDIIGGNFETEDGTTIIEALFGSLNPITTVDHPEFRTENLGPGANIDTNLQDFDTLLDYAQAAVNDQTSEIIIAETQLADEEAFHQALQTQFLDQSGVNIDEEISLLIVVQTAYSAAARAVSAVDEMFQELLATFR